MIGRAARCFGIDPTESELRKIEFVDKHIDRANRIILANPIFQAFREQRALPAIHPLNEAPHLILQQPNQLLRESHEARRFRTTWVKRVASTRSRCARHVRCTSDSDHIGASERTDAGCPKATLSPFTRSLGRRARTDVGNSTPSTLAVLRLTIVSNLVAR